MLILMENTWWSEMGSAEQTFWGIAIIFSVLFVIQFVLSLLGLEFDADTDFDTPSADVEMEGGFNLDTDFKIFSLRSIIAFFTFFGWTGVLVTQNGGGLYLAIFSAGIAGLVAMFLVAYIMYKAMGLEESGTFKNSTAINRTGEVYLTIPPQKTGYGKIHFKAKGSFREMDAVTEEVEAIANGSIVKIIDVLEDNLLLVKRIK